MTEHIKKHPVYSTGKLKTWLAEWPTVRQEIESMINAHSERDPSLHFELTLAQIELKDINESVQRAAALVKLLRVEDLTTAELQATGNY